MFEKLIEKGIRITTDAKELLEKQTNSEELIDELCKKDKF